MRQRTVRILLRVKDSYYPAVVVANGTIKPFYAIKGGKPICLENGVYYLRYTDAKGKRHCQYVGRDPKLARTMQLQRLHVIAGEEMGLQTVDPPPAPKPRRITPIEPPSVVPLVHPLVPPPDLSGKRLPLAASVDKFVRETTITRNPGTGADYRFKLASFVKACRKTYLDEIGDEALLSTSFSWEQLASLFVTVLR